jgi:alpha-galactosidase
MPLNQELLMPSFASPTTPCVVFDAEHRLWLLSTPNSSYAVRLADDDTPCHIHWGAPLSLIEAAALPGRESPAASSFESLAAVDELGGEIGMRFGPAGLQVVYADGSRGVEWEYLDCGIDEGHLRLTFRDRGRPLEIELHYRVFEGCDAIERWTVVRHTGDAAGDDDASVEIRRLDSASWTVPRLDDYRHSHLVGGWNSEYQLQRSRLAVAETVLTSRRGISSHHANPWLAVDDGTATETIGEVWGSALAWSGSWRITVHRDPASGVSWTGGFGHEGVSWRLAAGQRLETPVFAGVFAPDGFGGASRAWHSYIRSHVSPHPEELRPVVYNSWEATYFAVDEAGQKALAARAARLGVEVFVMDDGWFGNRTDDTAGLGDWWPNRDRFPDGLAPLAKEVRRLGMGLGLWVEPEMVNPDSDLYRAHPDWVLHQSGRPRTEARSQLVLNFARSDVAAWAHDWLDRLISEHRIDFLKWDMNRPFTEAGWPGAADPDRLWIDHVRAVYQVMDRLRSDHAHLRIEGCSGGGGRTDTGILAHVDEVWTSDNTDPMDRLAIQRGFSQIYPASVMAAWVADSPNPGTSRETPLRFRFHSAMAGVLGIGGDLIEWSEEETEQAAGLIAEYKEIRPVVQHGAQHRLTGTRGLTAVHYVGGDDTDHVILAWQPESAFAHAPDPLRLPAMSADASYQDLATGTIHAGAVLRRRGLPLDLPSGNHSSVVVRLRRIPQHRP